MVKYLLADRKGFTLVEVLVVMAIIGIVFAMTMPAFEPMEQSVALKGAARELAVHLRYAQQKAISEGVHHTIYVYPDMNPGKLSLWREGTLLEERVLVGGIKASLRRSTLAAPIKTTFNPTGNPVVGSAGNKTIVLTNKQGRQTYVVISSIGRVTIRE
ncbi:MAG: GspH/FimT family pseudopilin [Thermincolia bacterium]